MASRDGVADGPLFVPAGCARRAILRSDALAQPERSHDALAWQRNGHIFRHAVQRSPIFVDGIGFRTGAWRRCRAKTPPSHTRSPKCWTRTSGLKRKKSS
jgi:hypothetical protein